MFLDAEAPYLSVQRAWHSEHNRPVISSDLKTKSARRDIPLPSVLTECLWEAKEVATSEYVVANRDGGPLSYTQFKRVWQYIVTRSTKERTYVRYINGQKIQHKELGIRNTGAYMRKTLYMKSCCSRAFGIQRKAISSFCAISIA